MTGMGGGSWEFSGLLRELGARGVFEPWLCRFGHEGPPVGGRCHLESAGGLIRWSIENRELL